MIEVSSADIQKDFRSYREKAEAEPVVVLHYNKPSVVILSIGEFKRLKSRDKQVMDTKDLPDWLIDQIESSVMDSKFDHLNKGL